MKFTFTCKKVSLNDSIKAYAEKKVSKLDRYFQEDADAFVTFAVEKDHRCVVEITIRSGGTHPVSCSGGDPGRRYERLHRRGLRHHQPPDPQE